MRGLSSNVERDSAEEQWPGSGASARAAVEQWKPGVDMPPFTRDNPAALELIFGLSSGLTPPFQLIVSVAVAVQIYWLVF